MDAVSDPFSRAAVLIWVEVKERAGSSNPDPACHLAFLPRFTGEGDRKAVEGVAAAVKGLRRSRHPFRQALRACHLPRKTGEETRTAC